MVTPGPWFRVGAQNLIPQSIWILPDFGIPKPKPPSQRDCREDVDWCRSYFGMSRFRNFKRDKSNENQRLMWILSIGIDLRPLIVRSADSWPRILKLQTENSDDYLMMFVVDAPWTLLAMLLWEIRERIDLKITSNNRLAKLVDSRNESAPSRKPYVDVSPGGGGMNLSTTIN